ncbi:hypothetical protein C7M61_003409 [Candidozyma pseudohaemuli]|uniref:Uncharacterized protein n=1 Tax=Candidozyma pseudohaemuli TaxID=418784 RepID=A0A2P7YP06_9ASCO|nr:hypothetical protein C7M61_003409 [[Candida] pseudohaemulonii]PSK37701.1 hypothetical protein C7M61_003409 [[Candida] pseudohaemulonii]
MSLFRSLQNTPATISIFHNARVPSLASLFAHLERAYYQLNDDKNLFQLDMNAKKMPTYDQFKTIYSNCVRGDRCQTVLKECFPLLNDKFTQSEHSSVTVKSLGIRNDRGFKIFSQNEYTHIHEAFEKLIDEQNPEIDPNELFQAPLLIDWDQNIIANDMDGLKLILKKYKEAAKEK